MTRFTVTHELPCDAETFWKVFFDKTYNERLYREALGFPSFQILEQRDEDKQLIRRVSGTPKVNLPGPIAKLLGPNFGYTEEGTFDKTAGVWRWKMITTVLPDKLKQEGSMRLEPIGSDRVRRIGELTIEAKVFGLGGLLESTAEKQLREGWDQSAAFTARYLQESKK